MLPLNILINLNWQKEEAPAHSILVVIEYFNANYNTCIGRDGTILWLRNNPDLTLLDTFK